MLHVTILARFFIYICWFFGPVDAREVFRSLRSRGSIRVDKARYTGMRPYACPDA